MLLSKQNVSNVSSVDFTSLITSSFDNYSIVFDSAVSIGSSTDAYLIAQLSDDNGITYETTNYMNYLGGFLTKGLSMALLFDGGGGTAYTGSGRTEFHNLLSGVLDVTTETQSTIVDPLSPAVSGQLANGVYVGAPLSVNAITLVSSDGNPISGNFYLYGF